MRYIGSFNCTAKYCAPLLVGTVILLLACAMSKAQSTCTRTFTLESAITDAIISFYYVEAGENSGDLLAGRPPVNQFTPAPITLRGGGPIRFLAVSAGNQSIYGDVRDLCTLTRLTIVYDGAYRRPVMSAK